MGLHGGLERRLSWLAAAAAMSLAGVRRASAQAAPVGSPQAVLSTWFRHVERDELDSLRALLTDDFVFVSDGARMGPDAFVAMIKSLGITHPRVRLSNVQSHESGGVAYLVYDRTESFASHGVTRSVPETGTLVLVRAGSRWRIAQWAATSPH